MTNKIIFIHGLMLTGSCWNSWNTYFNNLGYETYAPTWKNHERGVNDELKEKTNLKDVIDAYKEFIDVLGEKPILVGHSLGAIIVQKLMNDGYAEKGICICSASPVGIKAFNWDFIVSNLEALKYAKKHPLILMNSNWYNKYVTNDLDLSQTEKFMQENCIASSSLVPLTIKDYGIIDFEKSHVPLLLIAGSIDKSQPPVITRKLFNAYRSTTSKKTYKEFDNRTHNIIMQSNWQDVADYINNWLKDKIDDKEN